MRIRILFDAYPGEDLSFRPYADKKFICSLLFEVTFTSFFKDKSPKEVTVFFLLFLLDDIRIRIRIHTSDSWILIFAAEKSLAVAGYF
jgi:hypothetical protein